MAHRISRRRRASGPKPFVTDVERLGHYQYTGDGARKSAKYATRRQSLLIHDILSDIAPLSLVDIGCGDGYFTEGLAAYAKSVVGFDLSEKIISDARSRGTPGVSYTSDFQDVLGSSQFDVAVLRGVLHHAEDPMALVQDVCRISDTVVVLEPNGMNPAMKVIEKASKYHREHGERSFTPKRIAGWFHNAGFLEELNQVGVLVPYFAPDWLVSPLVRLESGIESTPGVRQVLCGTRVMSFRRILTDSGSCEE